MDGLHDTPNIVEAFNTTQASLTHSSEGISLESFLSSLIFSGIYCLIQVIVFLYIQDRYKEFYDPHHKLHTDTKEDFVKLLKRLISIDIEPFRKYGLEAYFFLRFLYLLLFFFVVVTCIAIPVLIPVNYLCGANRDNAGENGLFNTTTTVQSKGLDLISTSNISSRHADKYIFHFVLTILIVIWFHVSLRSEIEYCIKEKNKEVVRAARDPKTRQWLSVVYLENISDTFKTIGDLKHFFRHFPGDVEEVWNVYSAEKLEKLVDTYKKQRTKLEILELQVIRAGNMSHVSSNYKFLDRPLLINEKGVEIPGLCERVDAYDYLTENMKELENKIETLRKEILAPEQTLGDRTPCERNVFLKFSSVRTALVVYQTLLSEAPDKMRCKLVSVNPDDIVWKNIGNNESSVGLEIKQTLIFLLHVLIIAFWTIPVALIGSVSQLPYLTALMPALSWINALPGFLKGLIAGILPTLVLVLLTKAALQILFFLGYKRNKISGAGIQVHLQKWSFVFLFFHLFLVITLSSGMIVLFENILYNPTSVPTMVAKDLPKASNFFFSFLVYRGLNLLGNGLLQLYRFIVEVVILPKLKDTTPRQIQERRDSYKKYLPYWGQAYPIFSVYASIGLVYSVISPLVLIFCCINFLLDLLTYKYLTAFVFSQENQSETRGKLYPLAWRQLYAGIYCLEIFLTGLLFMVRDEKGNSTCAILGALMVVVITLTVWAHLLVNRRYNRGIQLVPYELLGGETPDKRPLARPTEELVHLQTSHLRLKYLHPAFRFQPGQETIRLPSDPKGVYKLECRRLEASGFSASIGESTLNERGKVLLSCAEETAL